MVAEFEIPGAFGARLQCSVLAPLVEPFVLSMTRSKYAQMSVNRYLAGLAHLAHWMSRRNVGLDQLDLPLTERFIRKHVPRCRCRPPASCVVADLRAACRRLLVVGRGAGLLPPPAPRSPPQLACELESFDHYLDRIRGLALSTRESRCRMIGDFVGWRSSQGSSTLAVIAVRDVHRFLTLRLTGCSPGKAAALVVALRSYLRFRAFCGQPMDDVLAAVPTAAQWPLDRLPSVLGEDVIAAVERS
jgi:integrase/recombinase XerC